MDGRTQRPSIVSFRPTLEFLEVRAVPAIFTVTNLDDNGAGSLRQAVDDANNSFGPDDVIFDPALSGTISLSTGDIFISEAVNIHGTGADILTISGSNLSRIFNIGFNSFPQPYVITDLTLADGFDTFSGGAIRAGINSDLFLGGVKFINNNVDPSNGGVGAAFYSDGTVSIDSCIFENNAAPFGGVGGVQVSGLRGQGSPPGETGGPTANAGPPTDLTIVNSTITGNTATSGNLIETLNSLEIYNSTIYGNTVSDSAGSAVGSADLIIDSSIIFNNGPGYDVGNSEITTINNSIIGTRDATIILNSGSQNNFFGVDPLLGPLQDNGGGILTFVPNADSPAIDAGRNTLNLPFDQRGPGFDRLVGAGVDIGAVEYIPAIVLPPVDLVQCQNTDSADTCFVRKLYADLLLRTGDDFGIQSYVQDLANGASRQSVVESIMSSCEYHDVVIYTLYQKVLGRDPDKVGLCSFAIELQDGASIEDIIRTMVTSDEFLAKHPTGSDWTTAVFQLVKGSAPTDAQLAEFSAKFDSGDLASAADEIQFLPDVKTAIATNYLTKLLQRTPTDEEIQNAINAGGDSNFRGNVISHIVLLSQYLDVDTSSGFMLI